MPCVRLSITPWFTNYSSGIPIQINVYPDSLTIYNDGRLPYNWTVDDLFVKHRSHSPNPKIAYGFYRAGYIETWGRGIERIAEACKMANKPMPTFRAQGNEVAVTFTIEHDAVSENDHEEFGENEEEFVDEFVYKFVENADEFVEKFVENEILRTIVKLMIEQPKISAAKIAAEMQMTPRGVQKNIAALKRLGLIERVGPAKGGNWLVNSPK
jgi:ATP-dependent DNA helicase RecG